MVCGWRTPTKPIISEEVFRQVQEQICKQAQDVQRNGTTQIFSGLVKCADCGWSLAYGDEQAEQQIPTATTIVASTDKALRQCSMHYIRYDVLYAYVLSRLQYWSVLAQQDEGQTL